QTKNITASSRAQEFSEDFVADSGILIYCFCNHRINYYNKAFVISYISSNGHIKNHEAYLKSTNKTYQQYLQSSLATADKKKEIICDLVMT
ncbi:7813_t:CDS:1, partial [Scutellospora calospora]